jgi:hypothetical protein
MIISFIAAATLSFTLNIAPPPPSPPPSPPPLSPECSLMCDDNCTSGCDHECDLLVVGCDASCDLWCDEGCDAGCVCGEPFLSNPVLTDFGTDCDFAEVDFLITSPFSPTREDVCTQRYTGSLRLEVETSGGTNVTGVRAQVGVENELIWAGTTRVNDNVCVNVLSELEDGSLSIGLSIASAAANVLGDARFCWRSTWTRDDEIFSYRENISLDLHGEVTLLGTSILTRSLRERAEFLCPIIWRIATVVLPLVGLCCCAVCYMCRRARLCTKVCGCVRCTLRNPLTEACCCVVAGAAAGSTTIEFSSAAGV